MPAEQTTSFLKQLAAARARLVYGFERVPDERLQWSPGGLAKTPLQLAGKVGGFAEVIEHVVRTGAFPPPPSDPSPPGPASREEAMAFLNGRLDALAAAVEALTEADLSRKVMSPWREEIPIREWLPLVLYVLGYFQGQLNYLQMAYGDGDPNVPPEWVRG